MTELAVRPVVVEGRMVWSSLWPAPPPTSPLLESRLGWSPASRDDIASSIAAARSRRRWWRR